uniref:B3 domain-containing protein Os04g0386900 n=1 Tax=Anthurium amnicola TaxID=1678845 RepID=A0A1D1Z2E3_9ARAE
MTDPVVGNPHYHHQGRISLQENSLSSQESSNCCDEHVQSNGNKKPESTHTQEPLSGKPYFTCILSKSNVQNQFQLVIPRSFYWALPDDVVPVVLSNGDKTWNLTYIGDRPLRRFDSGWKKFSVENHLKIGDACVFELMDEGTPLKFKVQILDGKIPLDTPEKGHTLEAPIVID